MKALKFLTVLLALTLAASTAVSAVPGKIGGSTNVVTKEIKLPNGTNTGVTLTEMTIPKYTFYNPSTKNDKKACFTEFDLANTNLSVEVINCGDYMVSAKTVKSAVESYKQNGKTILAAINGDLWMTNVHSGSEMAKAVLKVPRGIMISKGEIWATQQFGMENACATNDERGNTTPPKAAFGVTSANQPVVGSPSIAISLKNETTGISTGVNGLNRLPAPDSTVVYNHRCYSTNYALNDAFEIEIESSDTAFTFDGTVKGTIKKIYESGSTSRPTIGKNTIVITVRGNRIPAMRENFKVGHTVSFKCSVSDSTGNASLWKNVKEAIGGHIMTHKDGQVYTSLGGNTEYPGAFIGYKDDGKVMFCTFTAAKDGTRLGINYASGIQFLRTAGYNSVFFLDGGGSATMVTLENGSYSVRSKSSDGSPRAVINAIAVVWNQNKVCAAQGDMSHIKAPLDLSDIPGYHIPADLMPHIVSGYTNCSGKYIEADNAYHMSVTSTSNDPYATLSFDALSSVSADTYKYMVVKAKTNLGKSSTLKLYYSTSASSGPSEDFTRNVSINASKDFNYYIVDLSKESGWRGTINNIRLDVFDSITTNAADGTVFSFGSITLCKTADEARKVSEGILPEGSIPSYKQFLNPGSTINTTAPTTEPPVEDTEHVTEAETVIVTDAETIVTNELSEVITELPTEDTEAATESEDADGNDSVTDEVNTTASETDAEEDKGSSSGIIIGVACAAAVAVAVAVIFIIKKRKS